MVSLREDLVVVVMVFVLVELSLLKLGGLESAVEGEQETAGVLLDLEGCGLAGKGGEESREVLSAVELDRAVHGRFGFGFCFGFSVDVQRETEAA